MLFSNGTFYHIIMNCHYQHLHHTNKTFGSFLAYAIVFLIPSCACQEDCQKDNNNEPNLNHVFGDRNIPRFNHLSIGKAFVDLVMVLRREEKALIIFPLFGSFFNAFTAKDMPSRCFTLNNNRERDGHMVVAPSCDMPLIRVC